MGFFTSANFLVGALPEGTWIETHFPMSCQDMSDLFPVFALFFVLFFSRKRNKIGGERGKRRGNFGGFFFRKKGNSLGLFFKHRP